MRPLGERAIRKIAKEHKVNADFLVDEVRDMESEGIRMTAQLLEDMIENGDI